MAALLTKYNTFLKKWDSRILSLHNTEQQEEKTLGPRVKNANPIEGQQPRLSQQPLQLLCVQTRTIVPHSALELEENISGDSILSL